MPGFDLEQALAKQNAGALQRSKQYLIGATVLFAGAFALAWVVAWGIIKILQLDSSDGLGPIGTWAPWAWASGITAAIAVYGGFLILLSDSENPDEQDTSAYEQTSFQQITGQGNHAVAGAFLISVLVLPGKLLAESVFQRRGCEVLTPEEKPIAQRITDDLLTKNDWVPTKRYAKALPTLNRLIRANIVLIRPARHTGREVRLNPSLMD